MNPKIHFNQVGYIATSVKTATITGNADSFNIFNNLDNKLAFQGDLSPEFFDEASEDMTRVADFSQLVTQGEYYIQVGKTCSSPFKILTKPFVEVKLAILKSFYFTRCGQNLHARHAGRYHGRKCHMVLGSLYSNPQRKVDILGGWHEGSTYGKNVVSATTALGHLLYAYELFPTSFTEIYNVPESGNGVSDILNSIRYELEWLLKMQAKDGGVYHKATSKHPISDILPSEDNSEIYVFNKSHTATACFSAVCALAARIYRHIDGVFSAKLQGSSLNAWVWLLNNPNFEPFKNPENITTFAFSDNNFNDKIFWASAELYHLTGQQDFHEKIIELHDKISTTGFVWYSVGGFGALSYLSYTRFRDRSIIEALRVSFKYRADNLTNMASHSGYGTSIDGNKYLRWSNMDILSNAICLLIGNKIFHNQNYITVALDQVNYLLGKNPLGISYISGFGSKSVTRPNFPPFTASRMSIPIQGLICSGPDMMRSDEYARWLIPKGTPPAKCYIDNEYCHCSDISLSLNSAAVLVLAFFSGA